MMSWWQRLFGDDKPQAARAAPRRAVSPARRAAKPANADVGAVDAAAAPAISLEEISERFHRFVFALPAARNITT